ncbi:MAG: LON peptidase substrate-binding domain-containing protein [Planctomycetota bacterium]
MAEQRIPDTWPPRPDLAQSGPEIPLLPLPRVFLYPHQLLPLHIFEDRYKALMRDILDASGQLVVGTLLERRTEGGPPPVLSVAGLGEVVRYDKTDDGRYLIWVLGRGRVTIQEVPSEHPYRLVRVAPLPETEPAEDRTERLVRQLRKAVRSRLKSKDELPEELPLEVLVDLLVQKLEAPQSVLEAVFVEPDVEQRASLALAAHFGFPPDSAQA